MWYLGIGQIYLDIKIIRGMNLSIKIVIEEVFQFESEEERIAEIENLLIRLITAYEDLQV